MAILSSGFSEELKGSGWCLRSLYTKSVERNEIARAVTATAKQNWGTEQRRSSLYCGL